MDKTTGKTNVFNWVNHFWNGAFDRRRTQEFSVILCNHASSHPWPCSSPQTSPQQLSPALLQGSDSPACCAPFSFKHITPWPNAGVGMEFFTAKNIIKYAVIHKSHDCYHCVLSLPAVATLFIHTVFTEWCFAVSDALNGSLIQQLGCSLMHTC